MSVLIIRLSAFMPREPCVDARGSPDPLKVCAFCGNGFLPLKKNRNHQRYCSSQCRRLAKKERDKDHKLSLSRSEGHRNSRREQNRRHRKKKDWNAYIREYRVKHPECTSRQNRKASSKYYEKNRRKIALRRSELRWQRKLKAEIEAIHKAVP